MNLRIPVRPFLKRAPQLLLLCFVLWPALVQDATRGANAPRSPGLEPSPITSVHLWFDRPVMDLPHAVLVDCLGQWAFDRGGNYVQVVISAARDLDRENLPERIAAELRSLFPAARIGF